MVVVCVWIPPPTKIFHIYQKGVLMKNLTVAEFIEYLRSFPQDAPIAFTWEGVVELIRADKIFISKDGVVMIGDDYRDEFESGEMSARDRAHL